MRLGSIVWLSLLMGCSGPPPAPVDPVQAPEVPAPAASGAYFGEDDPPAQGETLAERPLGAEALVAQRRPTAVVDLLFTSPDGLAVVDEDGDVTLLDRSGETRAHWSAAAGAPLSLAGGLLTAPAFAATLHNGEAWLPRVQGAEDATGAALASPRGDRFIALGTGERGGHLLLASFPEGALRASLPIEDGSPTELRWAPSGRHFARCSPHRVDLHAADDGALAVSHEVPEPTTVIDCAFRPAGGALAVLTSGGALLFLDARSLAVRATAPPPEHGQPNAIAWSSDGSFVATWRRGGGHVVVHDAVRGAVHRPVATDLQASSLGVGAGGRWLVVGGVNGEVRGYDLTTGTPRQLREPGADRAVVAIDPSGTRAAFVSNGDIHSVDLAVGAPVSLTPVLRPTPQHPRLLGDPLRPFAFIQAGGLFGFNREGLTRVARDGAGEPLFMADRARFIASDGKVLEADGRSLLPVPEEVLVLEASDGHTFLLRRSDSLVVRDDTGTERATLALDAEETVPCRGRACPLPLAMSPDGRRVAMLRDTRLRVFDTASGAVVSQRRVGTRTTRRTFAIDPSGTWLRHWGEYGGQLEVLAVDGLRTVFRTAVPEESSKMAFTGDGRFHAHTQDGELIITALPPRGVPRRVAAPGKTEALYAVGERWLVRETEEKVELFDAEAGALVAQVDAAAIRLVLAPRAEAAAAQGGAPSVAAPSGAGAVELSVVDCTGGALVVRSSARAPRSLGSCTLASDFTPVGPAHFAFTDVGTARIVRLADGASLRVDAFTSRRGRAMLVIVDDERRFEGSADDEDLYLVRAAGPVLTTTLTRALGRAREGISAAFMAR